MLKLTNSNNETFNEIQQQFIASLNGKNILKILNAGIVSASFNVFSSYVFIHYKPDGYGGNDCELQRI